MIEFLNQRVCRFFSFEVVKWQTFSSPSCRFETTFDTIAVLSNWLNDFNGMSLHLGLI